MEGNRSKTNQSMLPLEPLDPYKNRGISLDTKKFSSIQKEIEYFLSNDTH